jgi:mycofactocin precursor
MKPDETLTQPDAADLVRQPAPDALESLPTAGLKAEANRPAILEEVLIEEVSIDGMCGVY